MSKLLRAQRKTHGGQQGQPPRVVLVLAVGGQGAGRGVDGALRVLGETRALSAQGTHGTQQVQRVEGGVLALARALAGVGAAQSSKRMDGMCKRYWCGRPWVPFKSSASKRRFLPFYNTSPSLFLLYVRCGTSSSWAFPTHHDREGPSQSTLKTGTLALLLDFRGWSTTMKVLILVTPKKLISSTSMAIYPRTE